MAKISTHQLAEYTVSQLSNGVDYRVVSRKLASYLLETRQSRELHKILRAVEAELNKRGQSQVQIISMHQVTESIKLELASLLDVVDPVFSEIIDEDIVGGVRARIGEKEIDLTVKGKLQAFKAEIMRSK